MPTRTYIDPDRYVRAETLRARDVIHVNGTWHEVLDVHTSTEQLVNTYDYPEAVENVRKGDLDGIDYTRRRRYPHGGLFAHNAPVDPPEFVNGYLAGPLNGETAEDWQHLGDLLATEEYVAVRVFLTEYATGDAAWAWVTYPKHEPVRIQTPYTA